MVAVVVMVVERGMAMQTPQKNKKMETKGQRSVQGAKEMKRDSAAGRPKTQERERERECVCVCVCALVFWVEIMGTGGTHKLC